MDIQVSLKVRAAIKAKLIELGLHVDEELPDYIMVLVANRRTKSQMDQDLQLFLGENTMKFTGWLQHVLSKLDQLTSVTAQPASTAAASAGASAKKDDKPSKKKKKLAEEEEKESKKRSKSKEGSSKDKKIKIKEKSKSTTTTKTKIKSHDQEKVKLVKKSSKSESSPIKRHHEQPTTSSSISKAKEVVDKTDKDKAKPRKESTVTGSKRKVEESESSSSSSSRSPIKMKRQKETKEESGSSSSSTVKFQLKRPPLKKLPEKTALSTIHPESPPKRKMLPLLGEKSPEPERPELSAAADASTNQAPSKETPTEEFKVPPAPTVKPKTSTGTAIAVEDDEFLNLNAADDGDDDFLKEDKEDLELLRKKALESKNKGRNWMRSLQVNERIIQKQKEIEEKSKAEAEKEKIIAAPACKEETKIEKSKQVDEEPISIEVSSSSSSTTTTKEAAVSSTSPTKQIDSKVGSRIRGILLANKAENDSRSDAREILERKRRKAEEQVVTRRRRHSRETHEISKRESRDRRDRDRDHEPRERSPRSPVPKRLKSTVGALILRERHESPPPEDEEDEEEEPRVKVASVVHVTARPKRAKEKDAPKSLVIRAFADAQKSIVLNNSRQHDGSRSGRHRERSRSRSGERDHERRRSSRRRSDERSTSREHERSSRGAGSIIQRLGRRLRDDEKREDYYGGDENRQTGSSRDNKGRRSIIYRLGALVPQRAAPPAKKSIHERLGVKRAHPYYEDTHLSTLTVDERVSRRPAAAYDDSEMMMRDDDEDMIVVSVPSSTTPGGSTGLGARNVSLESMKLKEERPRISIALHDDSSDDDEEEEELEEEPYDPVATSLEMRKKSLQQPVVPADASTASNAAAKNDTADGGKSSSDEEYIVEEYEQEETDDEIEVVVRDTTLKLPDDLPSYGQDAGDQAMDQDQNSMMDSQQLDKRQQEQLQSEAEIGQIMAKGHEIRPPTSSSDSKSAATISGSTGQLSSSWQPTRGLHLSNTLNTAGVAGAPPGQCKYWPDCSFKDKCVYSHPKCKFGSACKNPKCPYKHSSIRLIGGGVVTPSFVPTAASILTTRPTGQPEREQCKFFPACHTLNCPFYHPTPCKFGVGCTDLKCKNYHPGGQLKRKKVMSSSNSGGRKYLPAAHLLKWSKSTSTTSTTSSVTATSSTTTTATTATASTA